MQLGECSAALLFLVAAAAAVEDDADRHVLSPLLFSAEHKRMRDVLAVK